MILLIRLILPICRAFTLQQSSYYSTESLQSSLSEPAWNSVSRCTYLFKERLFYHICDVNLLFIYIIRERIFLCVSIIYISYYLSI